MAQRRFAVLDRDGTVIVERHYLSAPDQVELIPGAASGLQQLRDMGLGLVLITNQSALGRGFLDQPRLEAIHDRLRALLRAEGVDLDGIYVCPHKPEDDCLCRKPKTALLDLAARELGFDGQASLVIGDKLCDVELGKRARATTFLVLTGYGRQVLREMSIAADYVVSDLPEAARVIRHLLAQGESTAARASQPSGEAPQKGGKS
jgi:D-glycero-D-manno-heptose 1,7-bisphosphate phosphatase